MARNTGSPARCATYHASSLAMAQWVRMPARSWRGRASTATRRHSQTITAAAPAMTTARMTQQTSA